MPGALFFELITSVNFGGVDPVQTRFSRGVLRQFCYFSEAGLGASCALCLLSALVNRGVPGRRKVALVGDARNGVPDELAVQFKSSGGLLHVLLAVSFA